MQPVQVILADSSPVVISGYRNIVEKHPRIQVVEEATTLRSLDDAILRYPESVSIVDWHMTTLDAATQIAQKTKLILSAMPETVATRHHALRLGARGFLGKHQSAVDIRKAVLTVASGHIWVGDTTAEAILNHQLMTDRHLGRDGNGAGRLTAREKQVIHMACQGLKSRAIGTALRISEPTVAHHFTSIYAKLGVEDRVGLIIYAYQHSLNLPDMPAPINSGVERLQVPDVH